MKVNIAVVIDSTLNEICLNQEETNSKLGAIVWKGCFDENDYDKTFIEIYQSEDDNNKIISVKRGKFIQSSIQDISEEFLSNLKRVTNDINESEYDGIEYDEENDIHSKNEINPYDPELIRVDTRNLSMNYIHQMMVSEEKEIDLSPEFQRNFVWNDITRKSRLIESLLLRIPLPVFYFSQDKEGKYQVIDGVQRLTVIKSFLNNEFKLKNLEYLKECEGKYYKKYPEKHREGMEYIDSKYVRWLNQTQLVCNIIDPQTPPKVKFDIFRRINTGGVGLNPQEIRNCLSNDKTRKFLKTLSISNEFKEATDNSVSSTRMADQELVLRFVAFFYYKVLGNPNLVYKSNIDSFLDETIEVLNNESEEVLNYIGDKFLNSMKNAEFLFGKYAFRKCKPEHLEKGAKKQLINKSLFITISIGLCQYKYEYVKTHKNLKMEEQFAREIKNNKEYMDVLTNGTSDIRRLNISFDISKKIIERNLGEIHD